ncbi:unnamed protein product, partial [marine sediment metagenome]
MRNRDTFIDPMFPLVYGPCDHCGGDNIYSKSRFGDYQEHSWPFTNLCTGCVFKRRVKRTAAPGRLVAKATTPKVQDAETMTKAAPN